MGEDAKAARNRRLAEALRLNLRRRKVAGRVKTVADANDLDRPERDTAPERPDSVAG